MQKLTHDQLAPGFRFAFSRLSEVPVTGTGTLHPRALSGFKRLNAPSGLRESQILVLEGCPGTDYENTARLLIQEAGGMKPRRPIYDLCYAENLDNPLRPVCLLLTAGTGNEFCNGIAKLLDKLVNHVDAERQVNRLLEAQKDLPEESRERLATYLSALSAKILKQEPFSSEIIINLMDAREKDVSPVICGRNLSWHSLFGKVNYLTEQGTTYSNQSLLEPGLVRRANGGYLILPAAELARQPLLWFKLANTLRTGTLDWENSYQEGTGLVPFFEPEPTRINLSVIITGDYVDLSEFYSIDISALDEIELKVSLESSMDAGKTGEFTGYLNGIRSRLGLSDFTPGAAEEICRHAQRECGTRTQFMIVESRLASLMKLASDIAAENGRELVEKEDITAAGREKRFRADHIEEESTKMYREGQIFIATSGSRIGQINGMSVVSSAGTDFEYGEPLRITATVHAGEGDIADVEYKANLAGQIHQKAMMIINGFLTSRFAPAVPLPLSVNLVFEQSYSEIDGDSASLSGLCAALSALSELPIKQNFAVTGALDQFGHVQPVGGLNEKIEGFYRVCSVKGLTGEEAVIIPASNINQLILSDEVLKAVSDGKFAVHTVETIDETIELLTGVPAGPDDDPTSVYGRIRLRIAEMLERSAAATQERSWWSRLFCRN